MYLRGFGTSKDPDKAMPLLEKGCNAKEANFNACFNLGIQYLNGYDGLQADLPRAEGFMRKACAGDVRMACDKLRDGKLSAH